MANTPDGNGWVGLEITPTGNGYIVKVLGYDVNGNLVYSTSITIGKDALKYLEQIFREYMP